MNVNNAMTYFFYIEKNIIIYILYTMMIYDGVLIIPPNIEKIDTTYKNNKNITDIIFEPRSGPRYNNLPLTIDKYAFKNCNLTGELVIPSFVVEIGDFAFENNTNLISIEFERNREFPLSIGDYAFSGCDLFELIIPKYITKIGSYSFKQNCNLTEIIFEPRDNNLSLTIENGVFGGCDLEKLTIPPFITSIGATAFIENKNLTSIEFEPRDNIPEFSKLKLVINPTAFEYCNITGELVIPSFVTNIGGFSFATNRNLTSIKFEPRDCNLVIGQYAFCACNITGELKIPNLVSDIERGAFARNYNLTSIKFETEDELNIGNYAFYKCNIQKLIIPPFIKNIGHYVFAKNDQLLKITIPVRITENYEYIDEDNDGYDEYYLFEYEEEYDEFEEFDKYNYKDAIFGDKDNKKKLYFVLANTNYKFFCKVII